MIIIKLLFYKQDISNVDLTTLILLALKYHNLARVLLFLLVILAGLPPVGFFTIKLTFFMGLYGVLPLILQILIFTTYFLTVLYYMQIFNNLNAKNKSLSYSNYPFIGVPFSVAQNPKYQKLKYSMVYLIFSIFTLLVLTFFFYADIYIISYNLSLN